IRRGLSALLKHDYFLLVNYNALSVSDARSRSFEANLLTDRLIKTFGVHNQLPAIHRICA
ncbi:hypothetical protein, partial [Xenorhabdus entomophaga]|uniref:hypothetical protein n=1 Tax=Xenorhabdus entomophaga TaxID=3136257 RepID=UPI0030F41DF1